jgi:hypothetical protein
LLSAAVRQEASGRLRAAASSRPGRPITRASARPAGAWTTTARHARHARSRTRIATIGREIDTARSEGPLQQIVVPPCPELLTRLQRAMAVPSPT